MGAAHVLPERIDADTARALVGNDRLYKAILPRAPWAVQKFRAGESISRNEARAIWEREKFDGAPRASEQYVASHELPLRARYDTSTFADREDYERAVAKLERRLFEALSELKALRPLRTEAVELPFTSRSSTRTSTPRARLTCTSTPLRPRLTRAPRPRPLARRRATCCASRAARSRRSRCPRTLSVRAPPGPPHTGCAHAPTDRYPPGPDAVAVLPPDASA